MQRRHFLRLTGLGVAAAWLPGCVGESEPAYPPDRNCWLPPEGESPGAAEPLADTPLGREVDAARRLGRPTLVLMVPDADEAKWVRGEYLGTLLHNGGDVLFRELACVHVACASRSAVAELVPGSGPTPDVPAVLVDLDADGKLVRQPIDVDVPGRPDVFSLDGEWTEREAAADKLYLAWVAPLRDALTLALAGDAEATRRRAGRVRSSLTEAENKQLDAVLASGDKPADALLARAAAVFRADDALSTRDEDRWTQHLAPVARARIVDQPLPGARWATQDGCAHTVDGADDNMAVDCGMGFVPDVGQRFLWFFTDDA